MAYAAGGLAFGTRFVCSWTSKAEAQIPGHVPCCEHALEYGTAFLV